MARKSTKTKSTASKKEEKVTAVVPEAKAAVDTEVKAEAAAKAPAKKTAAKKAVTKKTTAKTTTATTTHFFEIDGEQISTADIEERIREAYKAEGHRIGNMKDVSVYYNFAERRAYYVVNGKPEDKFVEF